MFTQLSKRTAYFPPAFRKPVSVILLCIDKMLFASINMKSPTCVHFMHLVRKLVVVVAAAAEMLAAAVTHNSRHRS